MACHPQVLVLLMVLCTLYEMCVSQSFYKFIGSPNSFFTFAFKVLLNPYCISLSSFHCINSTHVFHALFIQYSIWTVACARVIYNCVYNSSVSCKILILILDNFLSTSTSLAVDWAPEAFLASVLSVYSVE